MIYSRAHLITRSKQICSVYTESLIFHHHRCRSLLKRVNIIVDLIETHVSDNTVDSGLLQTISLLCTTFEEIKEYLLLFSVKNALLAHHIINFGSDEEQFIKWNERLQHCIEEIGLGDRLALGDLADEETDFDDYQLDVAFLKPRLIEIVLILYNEGETETVVKYLEKLLGHQLNSRSSYKTKTAPNAGLEIDPQKIKYDKVIGHGGIQYYLTSRIWRCLESKI